ncbi:uncharacterized protein IUM83_13487 [Phytophthora cinnamomi]|uniref:uncharacterized protein n=1 Tax=Phytophthora cinnamomi TaxID=4785 RepID=UPI00355AA490|nr:hypothetical protein IUM83_13487 [Phytophthora cinnamomi]
MNARAVAPERSTYEDTLERWALHDCSAVVNPWDDEEMRRLFQRWRATCSKVVTATDAVAPRSLDRSWTAFVERWNTEGGDEFVRKLESHEETHARLSVGALAREVCCLS